jgi:hypothetical protein
MSRETSLVAALDEADRISKIRVLQALGLKLNP